MNRLTNKKLVDLKYGEFLSISKEEYRKQVHEAPTYKEIYTKLGKIEDLEDELGCPLDVVFKTLKEGILVNEKKWWLPSCQLAYMKIDNEYVFVCDNYVYNLKDYCKTWWLKEVLE